MSVGIAVAGQAAWVIMLSVVLLREPKENWAPGPVKITAISASECRVQELGVSFSTNSLKRAGSKMSF